MAKINTIFSMTDNVSNPLKLMKNNLEETSKSFSDLTTEIFGVNQALQLFSTAMGAVQSVGGFLGGLIGEAGEAQATISRLSVALGDSTLAVEKFKEIQDFAAVTPFDVQGTAQAYIMLKNAGMEVESLLPTIRMIGDLAQGNNEAFNNMALNMMQIKASGSATAQDIKQFATYGVPFAQALEEIGAGSDKSFNAVYQAMVHLTSEGGKFYNSMASGSQTLSGRMANLEDSIQQLKATIGQTMLPVIQRWQAVFANFFESVKEWISQFSETFTNIFNGMYYKLDTLVAIIIQLGTVATIVGTVMAVSWAIANLPIVLTIALITTVIRLMFDITDNANNASRAMTGFGNQCAQAGQMFGMVIGFIVGTIKGLLDIIYNVGATIYNFIADIADFLYNLFINPVDAIARLFIDLGDTILQVLSSLSGAIDLIFHTNISKSLNDASRKLQEFKNNNFGSQSYSNIQRLELKDIKSIYSTASKGAEIGEKFGDIFDKSFENPFDKNNEVNKNPFDMPSLPPLKTDGSGALIVSDKSIVDIADDYRELLIKRATEKFNLQFSQITPEVNINGITVNNNVDLDRVIETITDGVEEASNTSLAS